jgi:hypothetical protein
MRTSRFVPVICFSSAHQYVKAGLLLGVGVANAQVKNAFETALGMCSEGKRM